MALPSSRVQQVPQPGKHQLAAAVRSINWSYALFWSISSTRPGVLTWKDGFYNGEVKTRKIANSAALTAEQLVMQRSEQLRELYEALMSGECDHRAARPVASLSPEDLGNTEWFYVVCMTYSFRPGHGLPGKSLASKEHVWMSNAHLAKSKAFPRALLAKSASIQTIVCIPLLGGVLELGTTDSVKEDPSLVSQATASFWEMQFPACTGEPCSSPSANENDETDIVVLEDLNHNDMEAMLSEGRGGLIGQIECVSSASLEKVTKEIDEFYSLCEEMDVHPLEDDWILDGSSEVPCSPEAAPPPGAAASSGSFDGSRVTSFTAWNWTRSSGSDQVAVPVAGEAQKLLKKVVAGGAWANNEGRNTQESSIKNHVMSERRRREKLNEMFLILKSLVPHIHKEIQSSVDKASILAETIAYLKELEQRVKDLESSTELISHPTETREQIRRHGGETTVRKTVSGTKRKKAPELISGDMEREHQWVLSKDGASKVTVTIVTDKDVLLEVQCSWEEMLMVRVFDAVKSFHLDVLSVQSSTLHGLMGLKIRAKFANSAAFAPGMISEAIQKAISKR